MDTLNTILVLLFLFQVKHMFGDFFLQTPKMLSGRGVYWHMGRAQHAAVHAVGSLIALILVGTGPLMILLLVAAEWVIHFHIDWWKACHSDKKSLTPDMAAFWRAYGVDQALHQFTYIAMIWIWATYAI